jgi:hypothetical protein
MSCAARSAVCLIAASFAAPAAAEDQSLSTEIRFSLFPASYRWSNGLLPEGRFAEKSLYFSPSLGARLFPHGRHGATIEVDYRIDSDTDSICLDIFGTSTCAPGFQIDFVTVHVGYAYRYIVHSPKKPYKRAWAFTPRVSFATGAALSRVVAAGLRRSSPVVGFRVGFDIDLHLQRFFLGWGFSYEYLAHTRGSIRYSHFFAWNLIPVFRMGVVIGRRVQRQPPKYAPFGYGKGSR